MAIVGTRRPTSYGLNCAERVAEDLSSRGLAITSGLARGIDSAAHRGALRGGVTYAVFGCGLDTIYPRENRKLAEMVEEKGAVLSEFPLGDASFAGKFSHSKPDYCGNVAGSHCGGSCGIFRIVDYRAAFRGQ